MIIRIIDLIWFSCSFFTLTLFYLRFCTIRTIFRIGIFMRSHLWRSGASILFSLDSRYRKFERTYGRGSGHSGVSYLGMVLGDIGQQRLTSQGYGIQMVIHARLIYTRAPRHPASRDALPKRERERERESNQILAISSPHIRMPYCPPCGNVKRCRFECLIFVHLFQYHTNTNAMILLD